MIEDDIESVKQRSLEMITRIRRSPGSTQSAEKDALIRALQILRDRSYHGNPDTVLAQKILNEVDKNYEPDCHD